MNTVFVGTLALAGGLSVTMAAQAAQPGDILYPIKTEVNESVASAMTLTKAERTELEAKQFATRIDEVMALDRAGTLDTDTLIVVRSEIQEQFTVAFTHIQELEAQQNVRAAATARAIMQTAIDYYLVSEIVPNQMLRDDLQVYSELMTQSLIATAVQEKTY